MTEEEIIIKNEALKEIELSAILEENDNLKEKLNCVEETIKYMKKMTERYMHGFNVLKQTCLIYMKSNSISKEEFCNALRDSEVLNTQYVEFDKEDY